MKRRQVRLHDRDDVPGAPLAGLRPGQFPLDHGVRVAAQVSQEWLRL